MMTGTPDSQHNSAWSVAMRECLQKMEEAGRAHEKKARDRQEKREVSRRRSSRRSSQQGNSSNAVLNQQDEDNGKIEVVGDGRAEEDFHITTATRRQGDLLAKARFNFSVGNALRKIEQDGRNLEKKNKKRSNSFPKRSGESEREWEELLQEDSNRKSTNDDQSKSPKGMRRNISFSDSFQELFRKMEEDGREHEKAYLQCRPNLRFTG